MQDYVLEVLKRANFFQGLSPEAFTQLSSVASVIQLKKKAILFREGEEGKYVCLLESGGMQLYKTNQDGAEVVIRTIRPGDIFGEVILFEQKNYPVTARALSACRVIRFRRSDFIALLDNRLFRMDFIASLMGKQRYLAERVRYLTSYDVEERFWHFMRDQFGEECRIKPDLSKKAIAAAIGATPETFSRLTQRLKAEGVLSWDDGVLELKNISRHISQSGDPAAE